MPFRRRRALGWLGAALFVSAVAPPVLAGQPAIAAQHAVFPVRIISGDNGRPTGVCVAVAREPSGGGHLRAVSSRAIDTAPLFLEHVPPESAIVGAGVRPDGTPALAAARLHDQGPGALVTLDIPDSIRLHAGAPVFIDRGLLAIASGRAAGTGVEVEELAASRAFLLEQVPAVVSSPPAAALFAQEDREYSGPTLDVPLGRTARGEIDVPLDLGARETILGATARLVSRTPLNLGEVT